MKEFIQSGSIIIAIDVMAILIAVIVLFGQLFTNKAKDKNLIF